MIDSESSIRLITSFSGSLPPHSDHLLSPATAWVACGRAADEAENADAVAAAIARLAADGLWLAGVLGLPGPDQQLRAAILAELGQMTRRPRPRQGGPE